MEGTPTTDQLLAHIRDLTALLALPYIWSQAEPRRIVESLLDVLMSLEQIDFAYAHAPASGLDHSIEAARVRGQTLSAQDCAAIGASLQAWLDEGDPNAAWVRPDSGQGQSLHLVHARLGREDEPGWAVIGAVRDSFPTDSESFLFRVAANQAAIALQTARYMAALRASEQRYRSLVTATTSVIWVTDAQGAFVTVQDSWQAYTGQRWPEHAGWGWSEMLHPDDRERIKREWTRALEVKSVYDTECRIWHAPTGAFRHCVVRAVPVADPDRTVREWVGNIQDVEEREQAEMERARLYAAEQRARVEAEQAQQRLSLLAEASAQLAASLDKHTTLQAIARLLIPRLADFCVVYGQDADSATQILAYAHREPGQEKQLKQLRPFLFTADHGETIVGRVLRTGEPAYLPEVAADQWPAGEAEAERASLARALNPRSVIVVPLATRGEVLAALALYYTEAGRQYSAADLALAEELAYRAALALDNARLYSTLEDRVRERTAQLEASHERLRHLAIRLQAVREEERSLIAREIHDEFGQALTGLKMDVSWLERHVPENNPTILLERLQSVSSLIDMLIQQIRRIAAELRPSVLDDMGLIAAIEWQLRDFQQRSGIACQLHVDGSEPLLDRDRTTALFRIVQEALTNVARHAQASRVDVWVDADEEELVLHVQDNGRGISEQEISDAKSLGLLGMRERVLLLSGEFDIRAGPESGTVVRVALPLTDQRRGL